LCLDGVEEEELWCVGMVLKKKSRGVVEAGVTYTFLPQLKDPEVKVR
jgi:hypothetical protein